MIQLAQEIVDRAQSAVDGPPLEDARKWQLLGQLGACSRELTERVVTVAGHRAAELPPPAYLAPHTRVWAERATFKKR
jgi:hypothetical protein